MADFGSVLTLAVVLAAMVGGALWVYWIRRHPRPARPPTHRPERRNELAALLHDLAGAGNEARR